MTVETEQSSIVFTGIVDGVALNVPFPVQATTEIKVRYGLADTLATAGVDYTVALVPPEYLTALVTPMVGFAVTSGGTISVRREVPYTQPTDIPTLVTLASSRLEQMFDRIVFIAQQLRDALVYSLKFPTTDEAANIGLLPTASDRASKYLGFDAQGKPIAVATAAVSTVMTSFGTAWVQLLDALAGRTYLGVYSTAQVDTIGDAKIPKSLLTTIGDIIYGSAVGVASRLGIGSTGQFLGVAGGLPTWQTFATPQVRSNLSGLTLSTAGSSATFGIAAGVAADSTNAAMMALASAYTKTTSAWALGTAAGALDTGAIANSTWYHVHLIQRADTGVVDVLISLSATAPTMPANYTLSRRLGTMQTNGSAQWVKFYQNGNEFRRLEVTDFTAVGTSAMTLRALSIPLGVAVSPLLRVSVQAVANQGTSIAVAPAADSTLSVTIAAAYEGAAAEGSSNANTHVGPLSNTSSQIYVQVPTYVSTLTLGVYGWIDSRGQDS